MSDQEIEVEQQGASQQLLDEMNNIINHHLRTLLPHLYSGGANHQDILLLTEYLIVGSLAVIHQVEKVDPLKALELLERQARQRINDKLGAAMSSNDLSKLM